MMDIETQRRNAEVRKQRRAAIEAEKKQDKALVLSALRAVLQDPEATAAQRLYAVAVLDNMQYYGIIPYNVKYPEKDSDALIADFAKRLEAAQQKDTK